MMMWSGKKYRKSEKFEINHSNEIPSHQRSYGDQALDYQDISQLPCWNMNKEVLINKWIRDYTSGMTEVRTQQMQMYILLDIYFCSSTRTYIKLRSHTCLPTFSMLSIHSFWSQSHFWIVWIRHIQLKRTQIIYHFHQTKNEDNKKLNRDYSITIFHEESPSYKDLTGNLITKIKEKKSPFSSWSYPAQIRARFYDLWTLAQKM